MKINYLRVILGLLVVVLFGFILAGCSANPSDDGAATPDDQSTDEANSEDMPEMLLLPDLAAAELNGRLLRVVATTSIIGDVVAQVGGDAIDLTVLMGPGQDPHSYEPAARDLTAVAEANIIFVNGWNLEEGLVDALVNIGSESTIVPISANITPLAFAEGEHEEENEDEHDHGSADPHVWFSVPNVEQWVDNVVQVLSELDLANETVYASNAATYLAELQELETYAETQLATIPAENRFLVTNHDAFGYFAETYGFTILGTVIPSLSTVAEPSATDLTDLVSSMAAHNVCTLFTEATVNDTLAQTVAGELDSCDTVQVLKLYTGAIGPEGSGADSYIGMFRANVDTVVTGLR
ncbi:MAG: zinc ABC transporter substrate-binding protein [Ardenticatenaceae bacterium]|nr:zinc ABC transporter substrate-binding protein [Ardenticatenaceae bacterium]